MVWACPSYERIPKQFLCQTAPEAKMCNPNATKTRTSLGYTPRPAKPRSPIGNRQPPIEETGEKSAPIPFHPLIRGGPPRLHESTPTAEKGMDQQYHQPTAVHPTPVNVSATQE